MAAAAFQRKALPHAARLCTTAVKGQAFQQWGETFLTLRCMQALQQAGSGPGGVAAGCRTPGVQKSWTPLLPSARCSLAPDEALNCPCIAFVVTLKVPVTILLRIVQTGRCSLCAFGESRRKLPAPR
jgi:hypothetical protein